VSVVRAGACIFVALVFASATGCGRHKRSEALAPNEVASAPSAIETRITAAGKAWARYAPEDQALVRRGDFRVGLDELAVYIARGAPEIWWHTRQGEETCNVLFYATGEASAADLAVLTCAGTVVKRAPVAPAIPCGRLAEFAPRMVEHAAYFETLPLTRQWDLAVGALERGQSGADIAIAYGKPYNSGAEAREDGSQATTLVFLDSAQEAYALHVTLVDDKVVAWRIPAERVLTPQAQQRHAADAARQAVETVRAEEQQAAARYAEEARARNEAQAKRQFALQTAGVLVSAAAAQAASSAPPPSASVSASSKKSSSEKTLTLNGCTYKESGGGSLGQSCSGACPASYICSMIGGRSGFCVPASQHSACRGSKRR
jgi:hypothetical protein